MNIVLLNRIQNLSSEELLLYDRRAKRVDIAYILLIIFGVLGIHRFYLGKWLSGILYLVSFGFFGLGVLYDIFSLGRQVDRINLELSYRLNYRDKFFLVNLPHSLFLGVLVLVGVILWLIYSWVATSGMRITIIKLFNNAVENERYL